jgi:molybdopterin synthase catalytic subunit
VRFAPRSYDGRVHPPPAGDTWCGLTADPLPLDGAYRWALRPDCGAVVVFTGTARDHSEGRPGVSLLEYEAYDEHVVPRLDEVAAAARARWSTVGRIALLHRVGEIGLTEAAVVVAVSAPHRDEAFEAARFAIDTLKADVPIWKRERWDGGDDWAQPCGHEAPAPGARADGTGRAP